MLNKFLLIQASVLVISLLLCGQQAIAHDSSKSRSSAEWQQSQVEKYRKQCKGYFQYGTVNVPPNSDYPKVTNYKSGWKKKGIPLSHTHIEITSAIDNTVYDVAIDNVFASDFNKDSHTVPYSYVTGILGGKTLYLCSGNPNHVPYEAKERDRDPKAKRGFDWVHTNCSQSGYKSSFLNGFIYNDQGVNLTNNQKYCYLWPSK